MINEKKEGNILKPNIAVVGSLNMDIVVHVEQLPKEGQTLLGEKMLEVSGGKGANQAVAMGKLQAGVSMIGKVGSDHYASHLLDSLKNSNVETQHILVSKNRTGIALVTVEKSGKNHIVVSPGANFELTPEDILNQREVIDQCEIVVLQLEIPLETVKYTLDLAKKAKKTTILNPAPATVISQDILENVDILIPNEQELYEMSEIEQDQYTIQEAAQIILDKGVKSVIVTLGEKGCCYVDHEKCKMYSAYQVKTQDTTAAGDSFIGGFVASYIKSKDIDAAIRQAQKVAAIAVTRIGAQSSLPTLEEVQQFEKTINYL